jgi:hypothetical protein
LGESADTIQARRARRGLLRVTLSYDCKPKSAVSTS